MRQPLARMLMSLAFVLLVAVTVQAFPKPSPYPISWELKFERSAPKRLLVRPRGAASSEAYWYITYTVSNLTGEERNFLPVFEMLTDDGQVIRSDKDIPPVVLETIRIREKNPQLLSVNEMGGIIKVGEDQAKQGVAIWREPRPEMGQFSIFVSGLSGESVLLKDAQGNVVRQKTKDGREAPVVLWKTLELKFHMAGDDRFPGNDVVQLVEETWVMR